MSLIQEALKRKSEEHQTGTPPAPDHSAYGPASTSHGIRDRVLLYALLAAGLLLAVFGPGHIAPLLKSKPTEPPQTTPPPQEPQPVAAEDPAPEAADTAEAPADAAEAAPIPQPPQEWPELELSGIASSGTESLAILNGRMVPVGRRINQVLVTEIDVDAVTLELNGEQRTLYLGDR